MNVRWRGMNAAYTASERELMRDLPVREQSLVHTLKHFAGGEIAEVAPGHSAFNSPANHGAMRPADEAAVGESAATASRLGSNDPIGGGGLTVYTDPEDLEFGKPKKTRPIYALVCTWKQSCRVPTKGEGEFWTKVWKLWYELKGWKVQSHDTGYFASKDGERHAILLHEYDKDSKVRLK